MNSEKANKVLENIAEEFSTSERIPEYMASAYISAPEVPCSSWSWGNRFITAMNMTTDARGYRQWEKAGRHVKKGAKAFPILAPMTIQREKEGEDPKTVTIGFRCIPVFRFEDTDGAPLPKYTPATLPPLSQLAKIEYANTTTGELASYNIKSGDITLCTEDPTAYFHELVHMYDAKSYDLKSGQDSEQEIVAELGACILARLYGVEKSPGNHMAYISQYASAKTPRETGAACLRMAERTMKAIQLILADAAKLA